MSTILSGSRCVSGQSILKFRVRMSFVEVREREGPD